LSDGGEEIPIAAGARLTGRAAGLSMGLLNVQTIDEDVTSGRVGPNNYTVLRARRDLGRANDVGAIFMTRQSTENGGDYNRVYGADWNMRFFGNLDWSSFVLATSTPGNKGGQYAWRTSANWRATSSTARAASWRSARAFKRPVVLPPHRQPKWFVDTGIRPRPEALQRRGVREMHPHIVWDYYTDLDGQMTGKRLHSGYTFFFNDGGYSEFSVNPSSSCLRARSCLRRRRAACRGLQLVPWQLRFNTDPSRALSLSSTFIGAGCGVEPRRPSTPA